MSAHTKGPLKVVRGANWWDREVWTDGDCYTRPICALSESEAERDEIDANARLFAAASELFDVAFLVVRDLRHKAESKGLPPEHLGRWDRELYALASAALAKATGAQP